MELAAARAYGATGVTGGATRSTGDASASILRKAGTTQASAPEREIAAAGSEAADSAPLPPIGNVGRRLDIRL